MVHLFNKDDLSDNYFYHFDNFTCQNEYNALQLRKDFNQN
ncbi:hypothetical protein B4134_3784 [Bacillus safensis]|nr:hypothetical protein B4134_3784 [Bacillus safensis]